MFQPTGNKPSLKGAWSGSSDFKILHALIYLWNG